MTNRRDASDDGAMTVHVLRPPFSLDTLVAEAKRRMRKRRVLTAVLAVLIGGGAAGAAVALNSSSALQPAAACRGWTHYYAYAVPQDPTHPPAAGSGATSWGWMARRHPLKAGDRISLRGQPWQVTGITAMPGVEPVCRPFGITGWPPVSLGGQHNYGDTSMVLGGRLILRPVN